MEVKDLRIDVDNLKTDVRKLEIRVDELQISVADQTTDMQELKSGNAGMRVEIVNIKILLENEISPRIQNIESCYVSTYGRYKNGVEEQAAMKTDIEILKKVVKGHSEKLQHLA